MRPRVFRALSGSSQGAVATWAGEGEKRLFIIRLYKEGKCSDRQEILGVTQRG